MASSLAVSTAHERRRRALRRKLTAAGVVVVVGVATGVGVALAEGSGGAGYRTAVATKGSTVRTLTFSGTVQPVNQAQASFQVSGTVSTVAVTVGQRVTAGQTLATLDTTSLSQQVSLDQTNLATAQAKLTQDESSQASSAQTTAAVAAPGEAVLTAAGPSSGSAGVTQAQQAVVDAQHTADQDTQTAAAALAAAQSACGISTTAQPGSGPPASGSQGSGSGSAVTTTTPSTPDPAACTTALQQAYAAEAQVSKDQQAVQTAEQALAKLLSSEASAAASSPSSAGAKPSSQASTSSVNSAAQLATDQASIDNDEASLVTAQQSLDSATLTAPMNGVVAAIDVSPGQAVTSNSSSRFITITDPGSFETVSSLTTSQVAEVASGDKAEVSVDGQPASITGTVSKIGPVSASSSGYTYPLVVSLDAGAALSELVGGSAAQVTVETAHASDTLVVPTSSVHTTGPGRSYVMVLEGGKEVQTTVRTGVIGQLYTQITSGVSPGAVVVLADPSQAVPSSSTNSSTRLGARAAFFGGGGVIIQRVGGGAGGAGGGGGGR